MDNDVKAQRLKVKLSPIRREITKVAKNYGEALGIMLQIKRLYCAHNGQSGCESPCEENIADGVTFLFRRQALDAFVQNENEKRSKELLLWDKDILFIIRDLSRQKMTEARFTVIKTCTVQTLNIYFVWSSICVVCLPKSRCQKYSLQQALDTAKLKCFDWK